MKIFITGATGFLGATVLRHLLAAGHSLRALARSDVAAAKLLALGAEPVPGDLNDVTAWAGRLNGCDAVVHCAAPVEFWGIWETFEQGIVRATCDLYRNTVRQGVGRFVHISSESVMQDRAPLLDVDETHLLPVEPNSFYGKSKKLAEDFLLAQQDDVVTTILRPAFIWGEQCPALAEIAAKVRAGQFIWIGQGSAAFEAVHVENVASAVSSALTRGRGKSVYLVTDGAPSTVREFFSAYFAAIGLPVPRANLPGPVGKALAVSLETLWKMLNIQAKPPLSVFEWAFVGMPRRYRIDRIKLELGYQASVTRAAGMAALAAARAER